MQSFINIKFNYIFKTTILKNFKKVNLRINNYFYKFRLLFYLKTYFIIIYLSNFINLVYKN